MADASKFVGVTELWQHNTAADVTNLEATTVAGFKGVEATVAVDVDVTAATAATSVAIALDGVKGAAATGGGETQNRADIDVAGAALTNVTVTGTLAQKTTAETPATLGTPAAAEVFTATFAGGAAANATVIFDGRTYTSAGGLTATQEATAFVTAYNNAAATWTAVDNGNGTVTFTKKTTGVVTDVTNASFTGTAAAQVTAAAPTTQGAAAVAATPAVAALAASLALNVTLAKDATFGKVDTAVATVLTIENDGTSTKDLVTVNASGSTGAITYTGADNKVSTIYTGSGNDKVTISTLTSNTVGSVVNAEVGTGAGNDEITVNTSGTGTTTVSAGDGDDTIILTGTLNSATRIDGGAGSDTVKLAGKTLIAEDNVLITNAISNVEKIEFTGATAAVVDASKLAAFGTFTFAGNAGDKVTEASAPALVTKGNLEALSTGYKADGADADTLTDAYGGNLNVTQTGSGTIDLFGASATLAVKAGTTAVASTVTGDVQTLSVSLTNGADSATAPTADTLTTLGLTVLTTENAALTSLTLSGNGTATVVGGQKLTTIDASGLGGTLAYGANKGNITGGLDFTAAAALAETIKLGTGSDIVRLGVTSTFDKMDTIVGFDAKKETNAATSTTDVLVFDGVTLNGAATGQATKLTLSANATTAELAFVEAAAADAVGGGFVFFQLGGDTYLFSNKGAAALEAGDLAVKIVGTVDFAAAWGTYTA